MTDEEKNRQSIIEGFNRDPDKSDLPSISDDKWKSLMDAYNLKPTNREEERNRLIEMGSNSDLTNDDLIIYFSDEAEEQLTGMFGRASIIQDMINMQKGTIVDMAMHLGITPKQAARMAKDGLGKMLDDGKGPSLDA